MEPLSAAASVIAVIQITEQVGKLCHDYIREVRHAREEIERLRPKVSALHDVLTELNDAPCSNINMEAVHGCSKTLDFIKSKLEPKDKSVGRKYINTEALKWPFKKKEIGERVQELESYLGIFNTALLINAKEERLLDKLAYAGEALFNSEENQRHRECLEGTRVDILHDIIKWADDITAPCIFWLRGWAGTGKSTIAISIASKLQAKSSYLASYFFRRNHSNLGHVQKLVPTLVRQLSQRSSSYRQLVSAVVNNELGIEQTVNFGLQYEKLLVEPLRNFRSSNLASDPFFIVMDALDECDEENELRILLKLLAMTKDLPKLQLKILMTSRPEWPIQQGFKEMPNIFYCDLVLQNVPKSVIDNDIKIFLNHEMKHIRTKFCLPADWPTKTDVDILAKKADKLFIFAATACRYIDGPPRSKPQERLKEICSSAADELATKELDQMYTIVLQNYFKGEYTKRELEVNRNRFHYIVGCIVLLFSPLSLAQLSCLLRGSHVKSQQEIEETLVTLHAVLDMPKDANGPVQPLHLSFREFLLDKNRCLDPRFQVNEQEVHRNLVSNCVRLLSDSLRRISYGTTVIEYTPSQVVQYACRHWVDHAHRGGMMVDNHGCIHEFLQQHFLHWLEFMSLMGKISEAIVAMTNLTALTDSQAAPLAFDFVHDCRRFVMTFRHAIEEAPAQVYGSALVFSPLQSKVRQNFQDFIPRVRLKPEVRSTWSPCLLTLECGYNVKKGHFFSGGKLLATSDRWSLDIWDSQTGECQSYLKAPPQHSPVKREKISRDGQLQAVVLRNDTLSVWDMTKSEYLFVLENSPDHFQVLEFSDDGRFLALGYVDGRIRLLDALTGDCHCEFHHGHSTTIHALVFSPDGKVLASVWENAISLWDIQTCLHSVELEYSDIEKKYIELESFIPCVFSPDSKLLALTPQIDSVDVWDVARAKCRFKLDNGDRSNHISNFVFSPDSKLLAVGTSESVKLWNMQTGICDESLESDGVLSAFAFSPNGQRLGLGLWLGLVNPQVSVWNVAKREYQSTTFRGHTQIIRALCFSPDGKLLASGAGDRTVRLWDMHLADNRPNDVDENNSHGVRKMVFSPNGKLIALQLWTNNIQLWNSATGDCCLQYPNKGSAFAFSPDSQLAASTYLESSIRLWNVHDGHDIQTFNGHSDLITSICFSPKGDLLASVSRNGEIRLWNVQTGECTSAFSTKHLDPRNPPSVLVMAPNAELLAFNGGMNLNSAMSDCSCHIWHVPTACLHVSLDGHTATITTIVFSLNSQLIATASLDRTVRLWNIQTGQHLLKIAFKSYDSYRPRINFLAEIDAIYINGIGHKIPSGTTTDAEIASHNCLLSDLQIDASSSWVTKSSKRVLWLPPEYRHSASFGQCYAVFGNKIVLRSHRGDLIFLWFEDGSGCLEKE